MRIETDYYVKRFQKINICLKYRLRLFSSNLTLTDSNESKVFLRLNISLYISYQTMILFCWNSCQEEFEDAKGITRNRKSKNRQHNGQKRGKQGQTTIYKTYTYNLISINTNPTKDRWWIYWMIPVCNKSHVQHVITYKL